MNRYDQAPNDKTYDSGIAYFQTERVVEMVAKRLGRELRYVAQLYPKGWVVSFWMPSERRR